MARDIDLILPGRIGQPFSESDDHALFELTRRKCSLRQMALVLERTETGVLTRLKTLHLYDYDRSGTALDPFEGAL